MIDQSEWIEEARAKQQAATVAWRRDLPIAIMDAVSALPRALDELKKAQVWQRGTDAALKTCAADLQKWQQRAEQAEAEAAQWQEAAGQASVRAEQLEDRLEQLESRRIVTSLPAGSSGETEKP